MHVRRLWQEGALPSALFCAHNLLACAFTRVRTNRCPTQVVEAVAEELQARGLVRLVVDPVLVSTSGDALATAGASRNAAASGVEGGAAGGRW